MRGKPLSVPLDCAHEHLSFDAVQLREVSVKHHFVAAYEKNKPFNAFNWKE
jgi:hypothetical protein